ncbi:MAG: PAS domain-containing sensor histidine kinase [Pseudomonadota bacterium]
MQRTFARQLRRICSIESKEELSQQLSALNALSLPPELKNFVAGLEQLFVRVQGTYEENERDLNLRSRSLEESSSELSAINDLMRADIASRNRVLNSVREAAGKLLEPNTTTITLPAEADLEGLSALLPDLVAQQEKRRLELFHQRFAMDQHAIVSITDTGGSILYVNDKFCAISGYSRAELIGQTHKIINSQHHSAKFFAALWKTISAGQVWHGEICNRAHSGKHYWEESTIVPFLNEAGMPYQYISIRTDITERKHMAEKIMASEKQYRELIENVHEVIFQIDELGRWCFLNPAWGKITGFDSEKTLGKDFLDSLHHDDINRAMTLFENLRNDTIAHDKHEFRFHNMRGGYSWLEMTIQRELDVMTNRLTFTGTLNDVTERRRIAQLQTEFVSVVSHELRTPITSIRGALALLDAGMVGPVPPSQLKLVQIAHRNSQRLVTLVNDILDMEKLMAGKTDMKIEPVNLALLIESAVEANAAYAQAMQIKLVFSPPPFAIMVLADANRLMQVMANLLSNAAKFSPKESPVEITISTTKNHSRVSVRDYGSGIPAEFHHRIFTAFAQADTSDTRQQGGTGLGLKISKNLIENMGGEIGFDSEPDRGTCFWLELPKTREINNFSRKPEEL